MLLLDIQTVIWAILDAPKHPVARRKLISPGEGAITPLLSGPDAETIPKEDQSINPHLLAPEAALLSVLVIEGSEKSAI
jgi:hypothetical protein